MRGLTALQLFAGIRKNEFSQFHTSKSPDTVCHRLNVFTASLHDDDFQAIVVIQMHMGSRKDHRPMSTEVGRG
jgi:hypothetical protein